MQNLMVRLGYMVWIGMLLRNSVWIRMRRFLKCIRPIISIEELAGISFEEQSTQ